MHTKGKKSVSVDSFDKACSNDVHTHDRNTERAYIAASRREDRSLEARVKSARRASDIHQKLTGKALSITEDIVRHGSMYEEIDERLPATQLLGQYSCNPSRKTGGDVRTPLSGSVSTALFLLELDKTWREDRINRLFQTSFPDADVQAESLWALRQRQPEHETMTMPTKRASSPALFSPALFSPADYNGLQCQKRRKLNATKDGPRSHPLQSHQFQDVPRTTSTKGLQSETRQLAGEETRGSKTRRNQKLLGTTPCGVEPVFSSSTMPSAEADNYCEGMQGNVYPGDGMSAQGWMDVLDYNSNEGSVF